MAVVPGIEVLVAEKVAQYRGRRVGLLCHPASVTPDLGHVVDRLIAAGIRPTRQSVGWSSSRAPTGIGHSSRASPTPSTGCGHPCS
jgi:hypothetical protein